MKIPGYLNYRVSGPRSRSWVNLLGIVILRGLGVLLQFTVNIFIARAFGPAGIGLYQLYNSWMVTIADAGGLGLPVSTMREVSRHRAAGDNRTARSLVKRTLLLTAGISVLLLVTGLILVPWIISTSFQDYVLPNYIQLALVGSVFFALFRILLEAEKACGRPRISVAIESLVLPGMFLIAGVIYFLNAELSNGETLVVIHIVALASITVVFCLRWFKNRVNTGNNSRNPGQQSVLQPDLFHIWGGVLANVILLNLPFYALPLVAGPDSIGVFAVSYRIVMVATTVLVVLSSWFGPRIAAAHARQDVDGIRRELKQARFISTLVYLPFLLVCLLYGQNVLAVFGEAFVGSRDLLVVLAAGQLVNALTGVPGLHLNMIGKSRLELYMAACSVLLGMPLCLIGGFYFGVIGLAVGFSAAIAFKNVGSLLISIRFVSTPTDPKAGNQHLTLKLQTQ
jgi:O-antigen/teichoic acid export membrane protein